jgi:hypothetical protein
MDRLTELLWTVLTWQDFAPGQRLAGAGLAWLLLCCLACLFTARE